LYPVDRMLRFLTTTAPTYLLSHVDLEDTTEAMFIKYRSHPVLAGEAGFLFFFVLVFFILSMRPGAIRIAWGR
jgi:hypothetical protein